MKINGKITGVVCAVLAVAVSGLWPAGNDSRAAYAQSATIDAHAALGQTVHNLNVDGQPLSKVISYLRDISGSNIVVNWKVLESVGVDREAPITVQVKELSLRKMLQLVLDQASPQSQLTFSVDANVIQVTTQDDADKQMVTRVYLVDDLIMENPNATKAAPSLNLQSLTGGGTQSFSSGQSGGGGGGGGFGSGGGGGSSGGGSGGFGGGGSSGGLFGGASSTTNTAQQDATKKGQDLVDLITSVIRPNVWTANGGTASIKFFSGKLIVTAPISVQEAIGGEVPDTSGVRFGG